MFYPRNPFPSPSIMRPSHSHKHMNKHTKRMEPYRNVSKRQETSRTSRNSPALCDLVRLVRGAVGFGAALFWRRTRWFSATGAADMGHPRRKEQMRCKSDATPMQICSSLQHPAAFWRWRAHNPTLCVPFWRVQLLLERGKAIAELFLSNEFMRFFLSW